MKTTTKQLILAVMIFASSHAFGQTKTVSISKDNIGALQCDYKMTVDVEKADTSKMILILFKNMKYQLLSEYSVVGFNTDHDTAMLTRFIGDLKAALPEIDNKPNMDWDREGYAIRLHDFQKGLYLYEPKRRGGGWTILSKKHVTQLLEWLEKIGFKS